MIWTVSEPDNSSKNQPQLVYISYALYFPGKFTPSLRMRKWVFTLSSEKAQMTLRTFPLSWYGDIPIKHQHFG